MNSLRYQSGGRRLPGRRLLGRAHVGDGVLARQRVGRAVHFQRPELAQQHHQEALVDRDGPVHRVAVLVGEQVLDPQHGGGEIAEPVGVAQDQHAAVHVLLQLPGGGRVGPGPVFLHVAVHRFELQREHLAVPQHQHAHGGDEAAGGAQLVLVLDQQQVGLGAFLAGAQRNRGGRGQRQAVVGQRQQRVELLRQQRAQAGRQAPRVDRRPDGERLIERRARPGQPGLGLHQQGGHPGRVCPQRRRGSRRARGTGLQGRQQRACGPVPLGRGLEQMVAQRGQVGRAGQVGAVDRQPAQGRAQPQQRAAFSAEAGPVVLQRRQLRAGRFERCQVGRAVREGRAHLQRAGIDGQGGLVHLAGFEPAQHGGQQSGAGQQQEQGAFQGPRPLRSPGASVRIRLPGGRPFAFQQRGGLAGEAGQGTLAVQHSFRQAFQALAVPVAQRAGRAELHFVAHQAVLRGLLSVQLLGRRAVDEVQDGRVDPPPGLQLRAREGRAQVEGREVQRGQQAELAPARVQAQPLARRDRRLQPAEQAGQGADQLPAGAGSPQAGVGGQQLAHEQAPGPGMLVQLARVARLAQDLFQAFEGGRGVIHARAQN